MQLDPNAAGVQQPVMPVRVRDGHPPRHEESVVRRDGVFFTATPCYGLHDPWWVVRTMDGEAPPVSMRQDDEWWTLAEFVPA